MTRPIEICLETRPIICSELIRQYEESIFESSHKSLEPKESENYSIKHQINDRKA